MTYTLKRIPVRSKIGVMERIGPCPRGVKTSCSNCFHYKVRNENQIETFDCLEMRVDKVWARTYLTTINAGFFALIEQRLLVNYHEVIIADVKIKDIVPSFTMTMNNAVKEYPVVVQVVSDALTELITTGKIVMEIQGVTKSLTKQVKKM